MPMPRVGGDKGRAGSITAGSASINSKIRLAAALLDSSICMAWASGCTASKLAMAVSGNNAR